MKNIIPLNFAVSKPPVTPFLKASQEWDERLGTLVVQAKNWRYAFFSLVPISLSLLSGLLYVSSQKSVVPVYVGLDKERGEARYLGRADEGSFTPGENETKFFLSEFIRLVRSIPSDEIVLKQNWLRAYKFLQLSSSQLLNDYANKSESPLKKLGEKYVTVQPLSVVKIPDSSSYQVRWKETVFKAGGLKDDEYFMLGTFHVELNPPNSEEILRDNPLGLYITNFQWNREL